MKLMPIPKKCSNFAPAIGSLPRRTAVGAIFLQEPWGMNPPMGCLKEVCVVIKRESGEKPGQSRCCKRLFFVFRCMEGGGTASTIGH